MKEVEIPEPLATALSSIAAWMQLGQRGSTTARKPGSTEDYGQLLERYADLVLPYFRQAFEGSPGGLAVCEVEPGAISLPDPRFRYFATRRAGSDEGKVTSLPDERLVALYALGVEVRRPTLGIVALYYQM